MDVSLNCGAGVILTAQLGSRGRRTVLAQSIGWRHNGRDREEKREK